MEWDDGVFARRLQVAIDALQDTMANTHVVIAAVQRDWDRWQHRNREHVAVYERSLRNIDRSRK